MLFVREVPANLTGRQRAEFQIISISSNSKNSNSSVKAAVKVDFNFGQQKTTEQLSNTPTTQFESTTIEAVLSSEVDETSTTDAVVATTFVPTLSSKQASSSNFKFKYDHYSAMLPEGRYGNRGALVTLRPEPLRNVNPHFYSLNTYFF